MEPVKREFALNVYCPVAGFSTNVPMAGLSGDAVTLYVASNVPVAPASFINKELDKVCEGVALI